MRGGRLPAPLLRERRCADRSRNDQEKGNEHADATSHSNRYAHSYGHADCHCYSDPYCHANRDAPTHVYADTHQCSSSALALPAAAAVLTTVFTERMESADRH